jgi:hypothetical protein
MQKCPLQNMENNSLWTKFFGKVARATKPGGRIFVMDELKSQSNISGPNLEGQYQQRKKERGIEPRSFQLVTTTLSKTDP